MSEFEPPVAMIELLMGLRARGIQSRRLLAAMERTPRSAFVDERYSADAYRDQALPIPCGQTISQPYIVAFMIEALQIEPAHTVLEIGTGSGYQTAILSQLAEHVVSIERYRTLKAQADERLADMGLTNVETVLGDGFEGYPDGAPYDRIIVSAAAPEIPAALIEQLSPDGGRLVCPVGSPHDIQDLVLVTK
ncbi:MAG: protein-L-isoaspartate(D-aspartate) O-methyltransferase, partial [Rhodobiaceae bacterium]|nr:protein-L-isoaspartate(D-aspartate) O-methyltransferase [Rhodobiaceae bacterium]